MPNEEKTIAEQEREKKSEKEPEKGKEHPGAHVRQSARKTVDVPKKRHRGAAMAVAAAVVVAVCVGVFVALPQGKVPVEPETLKVSDVSQAPSTDQEQPENPIDFDELRRRNPDVYAWLYVPGTEVSVPILQSDIADNYYLYHNMDRQDDPVGAPYTQSQNNRRFTDPVTVVYGHTFQTDDERANEAFGTLHNYEDQAFLDEHPYFYIYTPTTMFTYQVVSAHETDNSHILNTHDFSDQAVLQDYLDLVVNPSDADANVGAIKELEAGKAFLVQLSTCTRPSVSEKRFLVNGVMVGEHNYETISTITKA